MVNFVWRTDVHMADKGPSSRTDDWPTMVLEKLGQVRDVARREEAAAILDGGDFFHVKSPSRNTHELIRRTADHHQTYPCDVYCTPGNHDSVYADYGFLGQQPLGVLFSTGVFKRLYDNYEALFVGDCGTVVRVVGIPYHGARYDMDRFNIKKGKEDQLIVVAHVLASEKGGKMFEGEDIVRYADLVDLDPDVWCFGHWHKDQGVTVLGDKTFINVGALTRGSLSQDNVQRRPACVVIRCSKEGVETEIVRLKVRPAEEVFDVDARARQVRQQVEMDTFVENIRASLQPIEEGVSISDQISNMEDVPDEVRTRVLHYFEQVG